MKKLIIILMLASYLSSCSQSLTIPTEKLKANKNGEVVGLETKRNKKIDVPGGTTLKSIDNYKIVLENDSTGTKEFPSYKVKYLILNNNQNPDSLRYITPTEFLYLDNLCRNLMDYDVTKIKYKDGQKTHLRNGKFDLKTQTITGNLIFSGDSMTVGLDTLDQVTFKNHENANMSAGAAMGLGLFAYIIYFFVTLDSQFGSK